MVRIIFVDDEPNLLQGLRRMLHSMRSVWQMDFATSAAEAIEYLKRNQYDIIITDIRMPQMDGIELLEYVAENHPGVIRFFLSGQAKRETMLRSIGPMHQYLTKPADPDTIKLAIERSIALRSILNNDQLKTIVSSINTLPSLPQIYHDLVEQLERDEPSMSVIGDIISKDISMTAKILHLVNSTYYGFSHHISNVSEAVTMLGLDTIRVLAMTVHMFSMIDKKVLEKLPLTNVWDHSINTANIARIIAKDEGIDGKCAEHGYMGAILHDIGYLILAETYTEAYVNMKNNSEENNVPLHEIEMQVFGVTHAEVGAYLLGIWGLPDPIVESVCYHHMPEKHLVDSFDHVTAVYAANIIEQELHSNALVRVKKQLDEEYLQRCGVLDHVDTWRQNVEKVH